MSPHPIVIAHRGASGYRPEHTRAAYELAIAQGADAVEPDIVATRDGVLVVRHENEISGTTDVASRAEFADRRARKSVDGRRLHGWFTEDFTWAELSTLRARERLPNLRPANAAFDGMQPILRLRDVLEMAAAGPTTPPTGDASASTLRAVGTVTVVAEIKHATYFASIGLPLDELFAAEVAGWGGSLVVESFEQSALGGIRARGVAAPLVYLVEASGAPADLVERDGERARSYADHVTDVGLATLAASVDGVSVDKALLLAASGADLVARAHARGLDVYTWTLRPENRFLDATNRSGGRDAFGDWRTEYAAIMATGVDGVFADHPDLALDVRDSRTAS